MRTCAIIRQAALLSCTSWTIQAVPIVATFAIVASINFTVRGARTITRGRNSMLATAIVTPTADIPIFIDETLGTRAPVVWLIKWFTDWARLQITCNLITMVNKPLFYVIARHVLRTV
jgi:hypothetical protein